MPGQVVHVEIPADDTTTAQAFWSGLFGWKLEAAPGPPGYYMAQTGDGQGAAVTGMEPGKHGLRVYFDVDDVEAASQRVADLGGRAGDPVPIPNMGRFSICSDPHGNEFGLWQSDDSTPAP
jgi:predicted enzyme related to lactoylglutathione lyase